MWGQGASQISVSNVGPEAYEKIAASLQIRKVPHWSASLTQSGEETVSMPWASREEGIKVLRQYVPASPLYVGIAGGLGPAGDWDLATADHA